MHLVIVNAGHECHPKRDMDWVGEFCDANSNLFLIRPVIPAVTILSKYRLSAVKDDAGPDHVDVGMLEVRPRKDDILDVGEDLFPVGAKGCKNAVEGALTERWEIECSENFRTIDPGVGTLDAEIIRQFVAYLGLKQTIDIDTSCLMFTEDITEIQDAIEPCNEEDGADRKGYIVSRLNLIGS